MKYVSMKANWFKCKKCDKIVKLKDWKWEIRLKLTFYHECKECLDKEGWGLSFAEKEFEKYPCNKCKFRWPNDSYPNEKVGNGCDHPDCCYRPDLCDWFEPKEGWGIEY